MNLAFLILFTLAAPAAELPPNPPGFNLQAINLAVPFRENQLLGFNGAWSENTVTNDSASKEAMQVKTLTQPPTSTNDAPVRRWHGAMVAPTNKVQQIPLTGGSVTFHTTNLISVSGVVSVEELSRAVAFRRTTIPLAPPPMPASTNTNESATMRAMNTPYRETPAQRAQRLWFEHGGQKGRGR